MSFGSNQANNETVEPISPPSFDPNLPIVTTEVLANDYLSYETGASLFDLNVFKGKTLDEIDFDLIQNSLTLDPAIVKQFVINRSFSIVKNKDLNCFTFLCSVELVNDAYAYVKTYTYITIYLPLQADSKETLDVNSFKELAQKATNEQYLNSFNSVANNNNDMFQNIFYPDGISLWKTLIGQLEETRMYSVGTFGYDLANDEILKYSIVCSTDNTSLYRNYTLTLKNTSANKYEKIIVNDNTYLRITLGQNAINLHNEVDGQSHSNTHETSFYINITNWNN